MASPESIATNILSNRLDRLVNAGIIRELLHPQNKSRKLYYLTAQGKALLPILTEMIVWGYRYLSDVEMMEPIFKRIKANPESFKNSVLKKLADWEMIYL